MPLRFDPKNAPGNAPEEAEKVPQIDKRRDTDNSNLSQEDGQVGLDEEQDKPTTVEGNQMVPFSTGRICAAATENKLAEKSGLNPRFFEARSSILTVDNGPSLEIVSYLWNHNLEGKRARYEQESKLSCNEKVKLGLAAAIQIVRHAISYKAAFIAEQTNILARKQGSIPTPVPFEAALRLNENAFVRLITKQMPIVENNISKLMHRAENVRVLYTTLGAIDALYERSQNNLAANVEQTLQKTEEAISDEVSYAQKIAEANFSEARTISAKNSYLQAMYQCANTFERVYLASANNPELATLYRQAANSASRAADEFKKAAKPGISKNEQEAQIQSGHFILQAATARASGDLKTADRHDLAANRASLAAIKFRWAAWPDISENDKNDKIQSGNLYLQSATATANGDLEAAHRYNLAANSTSRAVDLFQEAAQPGISENAKNALIQSRNWELQKAIASLKGELVTADRYKKAANSACYAATKFRQATLPGKSKNEKEAWTQSGNFNLQSATATANGDIEAAHRYNQAAESASYAADKFKEAARLGISENDKNAYTQSGNLHLQSATVRANGDSVTADRYEEAANKASCAVALFQEAALPGISENKKNALIQSGNLELQSATATANGDIEAAHRYEEAANKASCAVALFQEAALPGISENKKNALIQSGNLELQSATATANGDIEAAHRYEEDARKASCAARKFNEAAQPGISENEINARIQSGNLETQAVTATVREREEADSYDKAAWNEHYAAWKFNREASKSYYNQSKELFFKAAKLSLVMLSLIALIKFLISSFF